MHHQSRSELFQNYLDLYHISPQKFAHISGMPLNEVRGLLEGRLRFTVLRANHLAAVFNTKTDLWISRHPKKKALSGDIS